MYARIFSPDYHAIRCVCRDFGLIVVSGESDLHGSGPGAEYHYAKIVWCPPDTDLSKVQEEISEPSTLSGAYVVEAPDPQHWKKAPWADSITGYAQKEG